MSGKAKHLGEQQTLFDAPAKEAGAPGEEKQCAAVVLELDACQKEILAAQEKLASSLERRVELCHDLLNRGISRADIGKLLGLSRVRVSQLLRNADEGR